MYAKDKNKQGNGIANEYTKLLLVWSKFKSTMTIEGSWREGKHVKFVPGIPKSSKKFWQSTFGGYPQPWNWYYLQQKAEVVQLRGIKKQQLFLFTFRIYLHIGEKPSSMKLIWVIQKVLHFNLPAWIHGFSAPFLARRPSAVWFS